MTETHTGHGGALHLALDDGTTLDLAVAGWRVDREPMTPPSTFVGDSDEALIQQHEEQVLGKASGALPAEPFYSSNFSFWAVPMEGYDGDVEDLLARAIPLLFDTELDRVKLVCDDEDRVHEGLFGSVGAVRDDAEDGTPRLLVRGVVVGDWLR